MPLITPILTFLGTAIRGFFGFKGDQVKVVEQSIETLGKLGDLDAQAVVAQSTAMASILTQGSFIERNWRAVAMVGIIVLIVCYFFGIAPPNIDKPLSPMMSRLFDLFELGLGGYIARYGIRDIVREFQLSTIIKTIIQKKLV